MLLNFKNTSVVINGVRPSEVFDVICKPFYINQAMIETEHEIIQRGAIIGYEWVKAYQ